MDFKSLDKINDLINQIPVTSRNQEDIDAAKKAIEGHDYITALTIIKTLNDKIIEENNVHIAKKNEDEEEIEIMNNWFDDFQNEKEADKTDEEIEQSEEEYYEEDENINLEDLLGNFEEEEFSFENTSNPEKYPKELRNIELEKQYIGMLLQEPKLIVRYHILYENCYFESDILLNIYKSILFTEGGDYTPERAKQKFNFAKEEENMYLQKEQLKKAVEDKKYDMEKIYNDLIKLCILRRKYTEMPIATIQDKIVEIAKYKLYHKMTPEEVESATNQVAVTDKFKQSVLNMDLTQFIKSGENNLAQGLSLPFPILSSVFKGIRKGETMAIAMPSNAGKSRFTVNLATYTALVHHKKVLIISNEMSEEKMRLTLITTIINNTEIQKLHGQKLHITEGELLDFKFRPDDKNEVKVDENGYVMQEEKETRAQFVKRLEKVSSDFRKVINVTDWINKQVGNSIYFINITDHTNDELQKVIMNYYYKEQIEYVFYDTLKTDTANIGNGEELKRTATILSNIAQNFGIFICSTLQLLENKTNPINLDINDLSVSKTVKEVLDTLCLVKQIPKDMYDDFYYSKNELDNDFFDLIKYEDPDERYYSCVVDKNRAGAKPKILFNLNLAYNRWEEMGYLGLKNS